MEGKAPAFWKDGGNLIAFSKERIIHEGTIEEKHFVLNIQYYPYLNIFYI